MYAELELAVPFDRGFDALYGLEIVQAEPEHARARIRAGPPLHGVRGAVHGGVFFAAGLSNTAIVHATVATSSVGVAVRAS